MSHCESVDSSILTTDLDSWNRHFAVMKTGLLHLLVVTQSEGTIMTLTSSRLRSTSFAASLLAIALAAAGSGVAHADPAVAPPVSGSRSASFNVPWQPPDILRAHVTMYGFVTGLDRNGDPSDFTFSLRCGARNYDTTVRVTAWRDPVPGGGEGDAAVFQSDIPISEVNQTCIVTAAPKKSYQTIWFEPTRIIYSGGSDFISIRGNIVTKSVAGGL